MKNVLMALLAGMLTCPSVQAGDYIIGGSFGISTGGENAASLQKQLDAAGIPAVASTSGDIRTGWQTFLAYEFLQRWGVELAYVDLGEATIEFSADQDIGDILDKIGDNHPRSAQGVKLSATYRFELNKNLQLKSKLGVFDWETSYTFSGSDDATGELISRDVNLNGTDISFGLGLVHKLSNNVSAHLDWDFYSIDAEVVNLFTFGVSYRFW